jgi:hypothetical protein
MPFQTIPSTDVRYALINFDDEGRERTDDREGGTFSKLLLEHAQQLQPSHIFLFSHGWKGDIPAAIEQYDRWIGAMWALTDDRAALGAAFRPLFIGLHWPSQPWGEESFASAVSFATDAADVVAPVLEAAIRHFGGGDDVRKPLETIFAAYQQDPAARLLPDEVLTAYQQLATAIGFSAGGDADAAPDEEGAPLDPQAAVRAERIASAGESFGLASSFRNGILAGLRQTSFWMMKHRARRVGEQGMHQFLSALQQVSNAPIHLMGHSFGCIVVSSILGGPDGTGSLPRPVASAVLVQGAMSLWSYADTIPGASRPGYFRHVLKKGTVSGPIITTQSTNDTAVGTAFPAAVGLVNEFDFGTDLPRFGGIGSWGIQGTLVAEALQMQDERAAYDFKSGRIYNLDASAYIPGHSDISGPAVAHLLWRPVAAARTEPV